MENGGTGNQELLVARNYQGGEEIRGRVRCLPAQQKPHRATSRQVNAQFYSGKALDAYISRFYH